ncbi:transcriptional regulator, MarR family [Paracoccus denitrificans PD1222]|uniref:Transcriptional regulator, MarR family n=1 Tax=Paracoccus denitrificans (strain Pd 1222) TaxID=318586 RepID=A1B6I4_PARDP|nr:transcriptional regulator, MarR family [Paracoccus denitrificans PD1222]
MSTIKVHHTHIRKMLPELHRALMDIASLMNRPERDAQLLEIAGLTLERALFPLLVTVERRGPIGVVELADGVGRDYTTVSRQIARLEEIGLVERRASPSDKRVREAVITTKGKAATDAVDAAREKMVLSLFKDWKRDDFDELIRLMKMLADSMSAEPTRSE